MARLYHLTLLSIFSFLLLTGHGAADLPRENKVAKIVTMTLQYPAAGSPPGEKTTISAHYVDENGGRNRHFDLDCDDDPRFCHEVPYHYPGGDTRCEGVSIRALVVRAPSRTVLGGGWLHDQCPVEIGEGAPLFVSGEIY